jgi:hypothetical protein
MISMSRLFLSTIYVLAIVSSIGCGRAKMTYTLAAIEGGGYELNVHYERRQLRLVSPEGMFPLETGTYKITVFGEGKDWGFKGRRGYYYSDSEVTSDQRAWDYCHAWVDEKRQFLYINAYWIDPPDRMIPSNVAGRYVVGRKGE